MSNAIPAPEIDRIAREFLGLGTLAERRSDRLDFHELAVWQLRGALEAAFAAGKAASASAKSRAK